MTAPSLIVVDAGNTSVKVGVLDAAPPVARELPPLRFNSSVDAQSELPWAELRQQLDETVAGAVTGSNPQHVERIRNAWPADFPPPRIVMNGTELPIRVDVDFPDRVGVDRLLAAVAANHVREPGQPAIIIASGTATTVNFVDRDGCFCGGAILPGFELSARALYEHTAQLPLVAFDSALESPPEIGRNTQAAITSGLYWGQVGAVNELMRRMMHVADHHHPLLLLTGGAAPLLHPHLPSIVRFEPHLVLQGLALATLTTGHV